jgi:hypothetical protein
MTKSLAIVVRVALVLPALIGAFWLGSRWTRSQLPDLGIPFGDTVRILEETPFLVPRGHDLVLTALGSRLGSITEIFVRTDDWELAQVVGSGFLDPQPVHGVARAGERIRVYGGLIEIDAYALGYLVPSSAPK